MSSLADKLRRVLRLHDGDTDAARERVERDKRRADYHASRIEKGTDALEHRVYEENHISAAVSALLKGRRT